MADCFITRRGGLSELHCALNSRTYSAEGYSFNFSSYCTKAEIKMIVINFIRTSSLHSLGCYTNEGIEIASSIMANAPITSVTVSDEEIAIVADADSDDYIKMAVIY